MDTAFDPDAHLTAADLAMDCLSNPSIISMGIKRSKTDPFLNGHTVCIGRTDNNLCPVTALLSYLASKKENSGPLFKFCNRLPLTRSRLVFHLKAGLTQATPYLTDIFLGLGVLQQQPHMGWRIR